MKKLVYIILMLVVFVSKSFCLNPNRLYCEILMNLISIEDNRCLDGTGEVIINYSIISFEDNSAVIVDLTGLPFSGTTLTSSPNPPIFSLLEGVTQYGSFTIDISNGSISSGLLNLQITNDFQPFCAYLDITIPAICDLDFSCSITGKSPEIPEDPEAICIACVDYEVDFEINNSSCIEGKTIEWDFGDESSTSSSGNHTYSGAGTYTVSLTVSEEGCDDFIIQHDIEIKECCPDCITSFAPAPGEKYVISCWVKEELSNQAETYINPTISLDFYTPAPGTILGPFVSKGKIIEGWQKIEEVIIIPADSWFVDIYLNNSGSNNVYFDDIRISPFKSSLKTYVYDPVTLRLAAELDENNYATFYQYDEEGKLIRVKKETERGVETIQESREASYKQAKSMDNRLNGNSTND